MHTKGVAISVRSLRLRPDIRREQRHGTATLISRPLSLEIARGQMVLVSGNNGIGKSTFLRYLAGLETSSSGQVFWDDIPTPPRPMSYLCQQYSGALLPWLSVAKNLALVLEDASGEAGHDFLTDCLDFLGTDTATNTPLYRLSGGQQHIAAIIIALAAPGPLVILDEPFSGLTWANAKVMAKFIADNSDGRTVVLASHASRADFEKELEITINLELNLTQLEEGAS